MGMGFLGAGRSCAPACDVHGPDDRGEPLAGFRGRSRGRLRHVSRGGHGHGRSLLLRAGGLSCIEAKPKRRVKRHVKLDLDEANPSQAEL